MSRHYFLLAFQSKQPIATRKGFTLLHYAARGSSLDLVKYLVKKGASLTAKTKAGETPLDFANNEEIRSFLEEAIKDDKKSKEKAPKSGPEAPSSQGQAKSSGVDDDGTTANEADKLK